MSIEQAKKSEKVKIMINTKVKEIKGDKEVSSIIVENKEGEKELKVDGVFVEIGSLPSVDFVKDLKKNKFNEIIINNKNETNIPGIFAAGDVTDVPEKQAIIAAGEGAKAALSAFRFLSKE
jgi:NADH-dependent peroxiredoxin subunit F